MADNLPLLQIFGTVAISLISAVGAWYATRSKGHVDIQGTINTGFDLLTKKLEGERDRVAAQNDKLLARIETCETRLNRQRAHIDRLESLLRQHGITPPEQPAGIAET